jgi:hypothetical protein
MTYEVCDYSFECASGHSFSAISVCPICPALTTLVSKGPDGTTLNENKSALRSPTDNIELQHLMNVWHDENKDKM